MNRMILAGARRGEQHQAAVARLAGSPPLDTERGEHLEKLLAEHHDAKQAGDAAALAEVEDKLDRLVEEGRAARTTEDDAAPVGFDGGVQRRSPPASAGMHQQTGSDLFREALTRSRQEATERRVDPGHTIIANA